MMNTKYNILIHNSVEKKIKIVNGSVGTMKYNLWLSKCDMEKKTAISWILFSRAFGYLHVSTIILHAFKLKLKRFYNVGGGNLFRDNTAKEAVKKVPT